MNFKKFYRLIIKIYIIKIYIIFIISIKSDLLPTTIKKVTFRSRNLFDIASLRNLNGELGLFLS
jgi:hypothetical protein